MMLGVLFWRYVFHITTLLCDVITAQYYVIPEPAYYRDYPYDVIYPVYYNQEVAYSGVPVRYPLPAVPQVVMVPEFNRPQQVQVAPPYLRPRRRRPLAKSLPPRRARSKPRTQRRRPLSLKTRATTSISGLFSVYEGFFIRGGTTLKGRFASALDCKRACASRRDCLAADYHRKKRKCFLHTSATACNTISTNELMVHYQKAQCDDSERLDGMEIFSSKFLPGGEEFPQKITLPGCIKNCTDRNQGGKSACFGIDYNYELRACYLQTNSSLVCPLPDPAQLPDQPNAVHMVTCT